MPIAVSVCLISSPGLTVWVEAMAIRQDLSHDFVKRKETILLTTYRAGSKELEIKTAPPPSINKQTNSRKNEQTLRKQPNVK